MKYKIRYDKGVDIAMIVLSNKKLAYESKINGIICAGLAEFCSIWVCPEITAEEGATLS